MSKFLLGCVLVCLSNSEAFAQSDRLVQDVKDSEIAVKAPSQNELKELAKVRKLIRTREISADSNRLIFKTKDVFEKLVSQTSDESMQRFIDEIARLNYKNYFSNPKNNKTSKKTSKTKMDKYLGAMLNSDGVVQIGEYAFKVDLDKNTVYVISASELEDHYDDFISGNLQNKLIGSFSTEQNVLDIVFNNKEDTEKSCGGIGGGTYPSYAKEWNGMVVAHTSNNWIWRLDPYVEFFAAGIYFRLKSEIILISYPSYTATQGSAITSINQAFTIQIHAHTPQVWRKRRYCTSGTTETIPAGLHWSTNTSGHGKSKTIYSGIFNLNGYYYFIKAKVIYPNGTQTVFTPLAGRNINSPY